MLVSMVCSLPHGIVDPVAIASGTTSRAVLTLARTRAA
jgi:hypothetical protein